MLKNQMQANNNELATITNLLQNKINNEPEVCTITFSAHGGSSIDHPADLNINYISYMAYENDQIKPVFLELGTSGLKTYNNVLKNSLAFIQSEGSSAAAGTENIEIVGRINSIDNQQYSYDHAYVLAIYGDGTFKTYQCFLRGTLVSLVNGDFKPIESINYNDDLLVWNFDKGCYDSAKPLWIKKAEYTSQYYKCSFSDGTILKLVGGCGHAHRLYCLDTNRFEYANDCVGKMIMSQNGPVKMEACEIKEELVEYYNIITDYHMNLYANNILSSTGFSNIYPIKDMKYIYDERNIIPIESFDNCPEKYYYGLRLGEQTEYSMERLNEKVKTIQELAL